MLYMLCMRTQTHTHTHTHIYTGVKAAYPLAESGNTYDGDMSNKNYGCENTHLVL